MTDHLSAAILSAFADGELSSDQAASARQHVDECLPCAASLIDTWLLKASIGKSGHRYSLSADAEERLRKNITNTPLSSGAAQTASVRARRGWTAASGWIAAAAMLLILLGWGFVQFREARSGAGEVASLAAEASDLHIAMLASGAAPQVVSSDRHTVKPWFQGKLHFSFNLPETLPPDTHLDGANLVYLGDQPVAQLLFSIGRHRASVFVEQRPPTRQRPQASRAGFQIVEFTTADLEVLLVSDVDRGRLSALAEAVRAAQSRQ